MRVMGVVQASSECIAAVTFGRFSNAPVRPTIRRSQSPTFPTFPPLKQMKTTLPFSLPSFLPYFHDALLFEAHTAPEEEVGLILDPNQNWSRMCSVVLVSN